MNTTLIYNAKIVNEGEVFNGSILIKSDKIDEIFTSEVPQNVLNESKIIDAQGKLLIPGVIDDQVHFRDFDMAYKADIKSESRAAIAGGVTSFMDMPNTSPQTTSMEVLNKRIAIAQKDSMANYSFYFGATNDNFDEITKIDPQTTCGIKVFMGSSTGNMLVDKPETLEKLFAQAPVLIATHCEDESIIRENTKIFKEKYKGEIPIKCHPEIRSEETCYKSSSFAVELAKKHNTRLHVLHLSTAKETNLFMNNVDAKEKRITAEVCVHHLWFDESDYEKYGTKIKWNPAVKKRSDKEGLLEALKNNKIDVIATDHAPHTLEEKSGTYLKSPSGGPLVQHSLVAMLELYKKKKISLELIVDKMCHKPAEIFSVKNRGFIRKSYQADLVLVDLEKTFVVSKENIHYKCKWSPFEGQTFSSMVTHTFVNGKLAFENGAFDESVRGEQLGFAR